MIDIKPFRTPVNVNFNEKRVMYSQIFSELKGDVNVSIINPGEINAWHKHEKQTDHFVVIQGALKFGVCGGPSGECVDVGVYLRHECNFYFLSDKNMSEGGIVIPPGLWHGYKCVSKEPAILLMYLDQKYDRNDEFKISIESMGWKW